MKQQKRHQRVYAILNAYSVLWLVSFVGDIAEPIENVSARITSRRSTHHIANIGIGIVNHRVFKRLKEVLLEFEMGQLLLFQKSH